MPARHGHWRGELRGWFDLFNTGSWLVLLGGNYLTDAPANKNKHLIAPLTFIGADEELHGLINGMPSFAHNASFDRRFLNAAVERAGVDFLFTLDGSIPAVKRLLPARRGYGLGALKAALSVDGCGAHRALADCRILLGCLAKAHGEKITPLLLQIIDAAASAIYARSFRPATHPPLHVSGSRLSGISRVEKMANPHSPPRVCVVPGG